MFGPEPLPPNPSREGCPFGSEQGRSPGSRRLRSPSRSHGLSSIDQWLVERAGPAFLPGLLQWRGRAGFAPASRDPSRGMSIAAKLDAPPDPRLRAGRRDPLFSGRLRFGLGAQDGPDEGRREGGRSPPPLRPRGRSPAPPLLLAGRSPSSRSAGRSVRAGRKGGRRSPASSFAASRCRCLAWRMISRACSSSASAISINSSADAPRGCGGRR
jgi:hypothetical protein